MDLPPPWCLALQWRFFFRLTRKPDNNFTLWPGFMPISHTIIPSNRLWAPKLSKHFCVLRFAMQTCWPMSKLIDGGRSRAEGGPISLVRQTCRVWALKGTSTTSTWITRETTHSSTRILHSHPASMWPQSCISNGQTSRLTPWQQI